MQPKALWRRYSKLRRISLVLLAGALAAASSLAVPTVASASPSSPPERPAEQAGAVLNLQVWATCNWTLRVIK